MSKVTIEDLEKNAERVLELVGNDSYVDWEAFTRKSGELVRSVDDLGRTLSTLREAKNREFIQTMKKMKSLDVPDLVKAVRAKKLPKEALRGILGRFRMEGQSLELVEPKESLREMANAELSNYLGQSEALVERLQKEVEFLGQKIAQTGYVPEKEPESKEIRATAQFSFPPERVQALAANVELQYLPQSNQLIGMRTYSQLVEASYELIKEEHRKLTLAARIKQRKVKTDNAAYLAAMNEYLLNTEALIIEAQTALAAKVGISPRKLEESEVGLMERGLANNILMLQSQLRARVKESMEAEQDVALGVAKEVIKYQTGMISERSDYIREVLSGLEKTQEATQMIPMLLALILNDMVFDKYGYEEEDFMKNVGEKVIEQNPELVEIFRQMELGIIRLMTKLGVVPEEVGKLMEQSASQRTPMLPGQAPQQPNLMAGVPSLPGMMPGANPMDMLQLAQLQQMQQMFSQMDSAPK